MFVEGDFVFQADAPRGIGRGFRIGAFGLKQGQHFVASAFERVDADVERRGLIQDTTA